MSDKDYRKLYKIQDKVFQALSPDLGTFYLTGGTALGRFYLNHRFSEDLDFFMNKSDTFREEIKRIQNVLTDCFSLLQRDSVVYEDFARYYIEVKEGILKIEFVNDTAYRCGAPANYIYGLIDTPLNILANKLTALVSRDEPKDIFDICLISLNYRFNWSEIIGEAKNKAIFNEIDVEKRIKTFPVTILQEVDWHIIPVDSDLIFKSLQSIADDLLLGKDNSLGRNKLPIEKANPLPHRDTH